MSITILVENNLIAFKVHFTKKTYLLPQMLEASLLKVYDKVFVMQLNCVELFKILAISHNKTTWENRKM